MHIKKRHIHEALEEAALLFRQGALQQARAVLAAILKADPRQAEALHLLGLLALKQGKPAEAESLLARAVKLAPQVAEFHNSLGVALRKQDKLGEAERSYRRCLKLAPDHVETLDNLGTLLRHRNRPEEAEQNCRRAVALQPDNAKMLINLAGVLYESGCIQESRQLFEKVLVSKVRSGLKVAATAGLIEIAHAVGNADECCRLTKELLDEHGSPENLSNYLMRLSYLASVTKEHLSAEHRNRVEACYGTTPRQSIGLDRLQSTPDQLRIGYLSPDLVLHPVGWLLKPVLSSHDQASFFTVLYDVHPDGRPVMEGIPQACSLWRSCRGMSDQQLADLIVADRIDILVDLAGHSRGGRLHVLAQRVAPVQVSWLGYFHTTGLPDVDWLLADGYSIPDGEDALYTEHIWRLPHFRFPVVLKADDNKGHTVKKADSSGVRFISFNNLVKITAQVLEAWAEILRRLPEATLTVGWKTLISEEIKAGFCQRFSDAGGNSQQLELLGPLEHDELFAEYHKADIMLDTFPFSGGMTSIDALSVGVPVVTLAGDRMAGRQTRAFLELSGHPELVAHSIDEYIAIAVELANDQERIAQLLATLRDDLLRSPLCDVKQFTQDLEAAYRAMWEERCKRGHTR